MALGPDSRPLDRPRRRPATKPFYQTSEFAVALVTSIAVLVASALVDSPSPDDPDGGFGARAAWFLVTLIAVGYMLSRGLAKSGSRGDRWDD
jgi:hypothetical protein